MQPIGANKRTEMTDNALTTWQSFSSRMVTNLPQKAHKILCLNRIFSTIIVRFGYVYLSVTLNSPPAVGGFSSTTFSINTYSTYSAIYLYILHSNSLEQAFVMAYSTYSVRRHRQRTVQCHPVSGRDLARSLGTALSLNYSRLSLRCEFESRVGRYVKRPR